MKKFLTVSLVSLAAISLLVSVGCSKKDPVDAMMGHMKTIVKLLKDNKADCDKAVTAVTEYVNKNKSELESIKKQLEEMEKKMSDEEKKKYEEKMKKEAEGMMKDMMAVMMEFTNKCPDKMAKLGEAMKFLGK